MDYIRQLELFNPKGFEQKEIGIIGCGSVGSFTCISLAKMGIKKFTIWDFDKIEHHNLPNQFFMERQLNQKKNIALKKLTYEFVSNVEIKTKGRLTDKSVILSDITILCVDNMKSRKLAYKKCENISQFIIDARMGGQVMIVYTVNLKDKAEKKEYEKTLYKDEDAENLRCTERTIIYNILGISSIICNQIKKILNKEKYMFEIIFDYQNMIFYKR